MEGKQTIGIKANTRRSKEKKHQRTSSRSKSLDPEKECSRERPRCHLEDRRNGVRKISLGGAKTLKLLDKKIISELPESSSRKSLLHQTES